MADGLFSRNATVMGPEQAMANVGRTLGRALEPALGMMGMQSEEQAVLDIMKGVDATDLSSVNSAFSKIMEISPNAAAEFRKQVMPLIESQQAQLGKEASLLKAEADYLSAQKKEGPLDTKSKEAYKNIRNEYKDIFCGGSGVLGFGSCAYDPNNPAHVATGFKQLPSPKQYFQSKGQLATEIYNRQTAADALINLSSDEVATNYGIPKNLVDEDVTAQINKAKQQGASDAEIMSFVNTYLAGDSALETGDSKPKQSKTSGITLKGNAQDKYFTLLEELKTDLKPLRPDFTLMGEDKILQDKRDAVRSFVIENQKLLQENPELLDEIAKDPQEFYDKYKDQLQLPLISSNRTINQELGLQA